ncbi:hypothetical protein [Bacillus luti]|nr:hypothetical protein [Bacillus luti]
MVVLCYGYGLMEERDLVKKLYHAAIKHLADKDAFYTEFKARQRW